MIRFQPGPNVVAGDSDTGKSYLLRCIDFVLGAKEMTKVIEEASGYEHVRLELRNDDEGVLTLERHLTGGDVRAYAVPISEVVAQSASDEPHSDNNDASKQDPKGEEILAWKRQGASKARDITSRVFPFMGMPEEVRLRSNDKGKTQRLSIRTLSPVFLLDEAMIIGEQSPVLFGGYDLTARKRMFSYVLTGTDDSGVIAQEKREIVQAEISAKLSLIDDLLTPIEKRLEGDTTVDDEDNSASRVDTTIEKLSSLLSETEDERTRLRDERREQLRLQQRAESQLIAIDELLGRYHLLDKRYSSDLERLDFIAEGTHFFDGLQDSVCPLCGQQMDGDVHTHDEGGGITDVASVYQSARAEAAKIQGLQKDLQQAITDLSARWNARDEERKTAAFEIARIDMRMDTVLGPARRRTRTTLDELVQRRLEFQTLKSDRDEVERLRALKEELAKQLPKGSAKQTWAPIDPVAVTALSRVIESVLKNWSWPDDVRVEFDERTYDIKVNGKPRRAHGKGFRAVLNSAATIGLLKYCQANNKPHPGFVVLDSPLTTVKQREGLETGDSNEDANIDPRIEPSFWKSLSEINDDIQIIVLDNKEPNESLASDLNLQLFAGASASDAERKGFIPI
ncbi:hypothetical protein [Algimonas porphyrae]|uniref:hypothetical protein n=1 Tax=Algimonas porphyrae TaxID=1128113 RepID=UPI0024E17472|nr:hypothetical protein [Algimonas porphyrae]